MRSIGLESGLDVDQKKISCGKIWATAPHPGIQCPFSSFVGINQTSRTFGASSWTKIPSFDPCFQPRSPRPLHLCIQQAQAGIVDDTQQSVSPANGPRSVRWLSERRRRQTWVATGLSRTCGAHFPTCRIELVLFKEEAVGNVLLGDRMPENAPLQALAKATRGRFPNRTVLTR